MAFAVALLLVLALSTTYLLHEWYSGELGDLEERRS
jgi:hypothetical protein